MEDNIFMEDNYGDMFITQSSNERNVVSFKENDSFRIVKSNQYSDNSNFEVPPWRKGSGMCLTLLLSEVMGLDFMFGLTGNLILYL